MPITVSRYELRWMTHGMAMYGQVCGDLRQGYPTRSQVCGHLRHGYPLFSESHDKTGCFIKHKINDTSLLIS